MRKAFAVTMGIALMAITALAVAQTTTQDDQSASYVSGTVVRSSSNELVIRTDSGEEMTFKVDSASVIPTGLMAGKKVDVKYHTLSGGTYHAAEVRAVASTGETAPPSSSSTVSGTTTYDTQSNLDDDNDFDNDNQRNLPQTASPLVLVGLLGLGSLGAGLGLRSLKR